VCGIAGYWVIPGSQATSEMEQAVRGMSHLLAHRGPDGEGVWTDAPAGVAFSHRRLSIVDLSPAGAQPMTSADGRWVISYNGEIYNHQELRGLMNDHPWRGHSDAEVLLELFARVGVDAALAKVDGMFAIALWDRREQVLHLLRDRYGEKPLYYCVTDGRCVFASELQAVQSITGYDASIDARAVGAFLRYGCVPSPWSIISGVKKLPPGTRLTLRKPGDAAQPEVFWSTVQVATVARQERPAGEHLDALDERLRVGVKGRLQADVPVAVFLSGGVDSSVVAAIAAATNPSQVRTFTVGFDVDGYDESPHAQALARHLGTEHVTERATAADALALATRVADAYDEPFADSSQLPTLLLCRLARRHVKVCLTGDGGDEMFGGYYRHHVLPRMAGTLGQMPSSLRHASASVIGLMAHPLLARGLEAVAGALPERLRVPQIGDKAGKFAAALRAGTLEQMYANAIAWNRRPCRLLQAVGEHSVVRPAQGELSSQEWLVLADTQAYLPDDVLVKVDRASMHVGLETRTPFLDHRLAEYVWSIPSEQRFGPPRGRHPNKPLLRAIASRYIPDALLDRRKAGFAVPLAAWLRGPLKEWASDMLAPAEMRRDGLLNADAVSKMWVAHRDGRQDHAHRVWSVLMLQAWLRRDRSRVAVGVSG
jgi:asparagine synthase (glutamine-hydrolysing)